MKKNKLMRIAAVLLVVTMLSTCAVSGTFAKYTTKASATDKARVAKFGIVVEAKADTFDDKYGTTVLTSKDTTASGYVEDGLVAPGTSNVGSTTFSIKGSAEVAVKVDVKFSSNKDVFLKGGTDVKYLDWTTGDKKDDYFSQSENYYPVVFTLVQTYGAGSWPIATAIPSDASAGCSVVATGNHDIGGTVTVKGTLDDINLVFTNLTTAMATVNPNYKFDDTFTLSWAWDFDANGVGTYDKQDTLLGNLAAGDADFIKSKVTAVDTEDTTKATTIEDLESTDYCLEQSYSFSITVTQVD